MKLNIKNNGGNLKFIQQVIAECNPSIGHESTLKRELSNEKKSAVIAVSVTVPEHGESGYIGQTTVYPVRYTGSRTLNSGFIANYSLPFQLTENAQKAWEAFVDILAEKMLEYISNN